MASTTSTDLEFVWGDSRTNVWALGQGVILHWDGGAWASQPFDGGTFYGLWGGADGAWATTRSGVVDLNVTGWSAQPLDAGLDGGQYNFGGATWGISREDYWIAQPYIGLIHVVGQGGAITATPEPATDIWGSSDEDLIASGFKLLGAGADVPEDGFVEEWKNGTWSPYFLPCRACLSSMGPVWGACPNEVWIAENGYPDINGAQICRWSGSSCVDEPLSAPAGPIFGISGSAHRVWAVGGSGSALIYHADK